MIAEVLILSAVFIGTMIALGFIIKNTDNSSPNTINIYTNNDKSTEKEACNYITEEHMKQELDRIRTEVKLDIKAQEELNRINEHRKNSKLKNINKEC